MTKNNITKIVSKQILKLVSISGVLFLSSCATYNNKYSNLEKTTQLALCVATPEMLEFERNILIERGFRRVSKNSFAPVIAQNIFGHKIRVINLESKFTKIYVSGNPVELEYNFKRIVPSISCENNSCQATINNKQTLHIYKSKARKTKDTSIIECTKIEKQEE